MKTITIKKSFIIGAVIVGTIAALSQLFVQGDSEDVIELRALFQESKKKRYQNRKDAFALLEEINKSVNLPENLIQNYQELTLDNAKNEKEAKQYHNALNIAKTNQKVNGFPHMKSFFTGIGMPVLVLMLSIIFYLLYIRRKSINFQEISKSFIFISLLSFSCSAVYLIWGFSPRTEIHKAFYISGLFCASIVAVFFLLKFLKYIFRSDKEQVLQKALNAFAFFAFKGARKHIKEGKKASLEYDKDLAQTLKDGM